MDVRGLILRAQTGADLKELRACMDRIWATGRPSRLRRFREQAADAALETKDDNITYLVLLMLEDGCLSGRRSGGPDGRPAEDPEWIRVSSRLACDGRWELLRLLNLHRSPQLNSAALSTLLRHPLKTVRWLLDSQDTPTARRLWSEQSILIADLELAIYLQDEKGCTVDWKGLACHLARGAAGDPAQASRLCEQLTSYPETLKQVYWQSIDNGWADLAVVAGMLLWEQDLEKTPQPPFCFDETTPWAARFTAHSSAAQTRALLKAARFQVRSRDIEYAHGTLGIPYEELLKEGACTVIIPSPPSSAIAPMPPHAYLERAEHDCPAVARPRAAGD